MSQRLALVTLERCHEPGGDFDGARGRADGSPFALNRDDLRRLPGAPRGIGEVLRDDLLAAERDDEHGADVGMCAVGGQRVVRDAAGPGRAGRSRPDVASAAPSGATAAAMRSATTDAQITVGTTSR